MDETHTPPPSRPVFVAGSRRRHRTLSLAAGAVGVGLVAYLVVVTAALTGAPWVPDLGLPGVEPTDGRAADIAPADDGPALAPTGTAPPATTTATPPSTSTTAASASTATAAPTAPTPPTSPTPTTSTTAPPVTSPPTTLPPPSPAEPPAEPGRPDAAGRPTDPGSNGQGTINRSPRAAG